MLVHRRVTPSIEFAGTHLYTWPKKGIMTIKCLAQEHNTVLRPGLEPGPLDPESSRYSPLVLAKLKIKEMVQFHT